jgi:hypothetical protein
MCCLSDHQGVERTAFTPFLPRLRSRRSPTRSAYASTSAPSHRTLSPQPLSPPQEPGPRVPVWNPSMSFSTPAGALTSPPSRIFCLHSGLRWIGQTPRWRPFRPYRRRQGFDKEATDEAGFFPRLHHTLRTFPRHDLALRPRSSRREHHLRTSSRHQDHPSGGRSC